MKKFFAALVICLALCQPSYSDEAYDAQHTMLALNMAIVSVHNILTAENRAVLEQEYNNIINNLSIGNIESDLEIIELYRELMTVITSKRLREEDSKRLQDFYNASEQKLIAYALSSIRENEAYIKAAQGNEKVIAKELPKYGTKENWVIGLGTANWITNLALSAIPSFELSGSFFKAKAGLKVTNNVKNKSDVIFRDTVNAYERLERERIQAEKDLQEARNQQIILRAKIDSLREELASDTAMLREEMSQEKWQLQRQEIEECDSLQQKLLNSSWNLLRKYRLPDNYRLTQNILKNYSKALDESDPAKRLRMLRALEDEFRVYPPYWYYRAKAAESAGNERELKESFKKFSEVWRPVLRKDPYKVEAEKYHVRQLAEDNALTHKEEIIAALDVIRRNTPKEDWPNNLFAGVALFVMGEHEQGKKCLKVNSYFDYEHNISDTLLAQMNTGNLDASSTFEALMNLERRLRLEKLTEDMKPSTKNIALALADLFDGVDGARERLEQLGFAVDKPIISEVMPFIKRYADAGNEPARNLINEHQRYIREVEARQARERQAREAEELYQMGMNLYYGMKHNAKTVEYFTRAANGGHSEAQRMLVFCYENGFAVNQNLQKARYWYEKAAAQGDEYAKKALQNMKW